MHIHFNVGINQLNEFMHAFQFFFFFDCFCLDLMQYHIETQLAKGPWDLNLRATTSTMVVLKSSSLICLYLFLPDH